jgi:aspartate racemase
MNQRAAPRHLAVIGGLGQLAGADLFGKLRRTVEGQGTAAQYRLALEAHHPYDRGDGTGIEPERIGDRKLYLYDTAALLEASSADAVLLPCFVSHTFLDELQREVQVPILNMMEALAARLAEEPARLGILCTRYVQEARLFERYFDAERLRYPSPATHAACIEPAMYGPGGILAGSTGGPVLERLADACGDLLAQGAQLIVPGASEIAVMAQALRGRGLPVLDSHQVYVEHALASREEPAGVFKVGVIGGVGPAATVDFMRKVIQNTAAARDQDHIRLVVDHNPKIPDRTANLIGDGTDPTLALYSACKRLEANGVAAIAIPCNTAHAFVPRLQAKLAVPIVNMLNETVRHIREHHPGHRKVGLLATTGTVESRVYHAAADGAPFELIVPDAGHQELVMEAIYGERGVKAGHTEGACKEALLQALGHLVERGATVAILGCTELPLILPEDPAFDAGAGTVVLLDPTAILARRCVALAKEAEGGRRAGP